MLRVIQTKSEVGKVQRIFKSKLSKLEDKSGIITVGYQGENQRLKAHWSKSLNIWWVTETTGNRYWNAFGIDEPKWNTGHSHDIVCEINPPFQGINRRIAGVFAEDLNGKLYLMHRGIIGGGRKNVGKNLFLNEFQGKWEVVEDGNELSKLAFVACLDTPRFSEQIADFVHEVKQIKARASQMTVKTVSPLVLPASFSDEFFGTKKTKITSNEYEAKCDHGLVVKMLKEILVQKGMNIVNNVNIDLLSLDSKGNPDNLFEIKTDTATTSVYGAIGQLLYHSTRLNKKCMLVAVFPKDLDVDSTNVLQKLNIRCVTYEWINKKPRFHNLP